MSTAPELTPARRRALEVLVGGPVARYSNETDGAQGLIYWQSADWLLENNYAYRGGPHKQELRPTSDGLARARAEGITVAAVNR